VTEFSNSAIKTFKTCRRKYWLTYVRKFTVKPSKRIPHGVAELGTRVHLALEAYYGYNLDPLAVLNLVYQWAVQEYPNFAEDLTKEHAWAAVMTEGYLQWSSENGTDVGLDVIATERIVSRETVLPDGRAVSLVGKLDQTIRRQSDGAILTRDWKTVGTLTKANALLRDEQMRFYTMLQALSARESGERSTGVLYTMLLRSKRTARAKGPFYEQIEVSFNRHDLNSMWLRSIETVREILDFTARLENGEDHRSVAYPNPDIHCTWCPFVSVCHLADDGSRFEDALSYEFSPGDPWAYYGNELIDKVLAAFDRHR
jgi:hypothetical protein